MNVNPAGGCEGVGGMTARGTVLHASNMKRAEVSPCLDLVPTCTVKGRNQ